MCYWAAVSSIGCERPYVIAPEGVVVVASNGLDKTIDALGEAELGIQGAVHQTSFSLGLPLSLFLVSVIRRIVKMSKQSVCHTIFKPMIWAWTSPEAYCSEVPAPAALAMPTMAEPAAARELMRTILTMQRNKVTGVGAGCAIRGGRAGRAVYLYPKLH